MESTRVATLVAAHHDALAAWLADADRDALDLFLAAHVPDFTLVTVDGDMIEGAQVRDALIGAGGSQPGLHIGIDEIAEIAAAGDIVVVRFRESHRTDGATQHRRSTAVLRSRGADVEWLTVHETASEMQ